MLYLDYKILTELVMIIVLHTLGHKRGILFLTCLMWKRITKMNPYFQQWQWIWNCNFFLRDIRSGEPRWFTRPNQLLSDQKKIVIFLIFHCWWLACSFLLSGWCSSYLLFFSRFSSSKSNDRAIPDNWSWNPRVFIGPVVILPDLSIGISFSLQW